MTASSDEIIDDATLLSAIGMLADALERITLPGVLELRLLARSLRKAEQTRQRTALEFAATTFGSLEADIRDQIFRHAVGFARDSVAARQSLAPLLGPIAAEPAVAPAPRRGSLLDAVNGRPALTARR
ncbi:MAG TPA: hypothetical protein VEH84_03360 [Alphaproteobacteria bacterium]|nr:hypothetical protein [Alphaproteobacteria bacterium]